MSLARIAVPALILLAAGGCSRTGDIEASGGGAGITAVRTACPIVAVPAGTGDITLFNPPASRDAAAIDVTAALTNVQSTCNDAGDQVVTNVTFDVLARRAQPGPARTVTFPYFITVVRGGNAVVAKRVHQIAVQFGDGQLRAQASGQASTSIDRAAATLPQDVRERLTRRRRAGEEAAAMDPLADPAVRGAVAAATFEALVGFQLTEDQLKYNVTR
ncbi:MAG: hypothetical protein J7500_15290 [Sphingomonas sp.]|uniref:hypothetical protein n=1 Tax=Sphingomonas sp. TaxID=28214 RepID=UPI001B280195|nr:hypothetical protein [Sphingomonas sp.]MBO9624071.1 hypothetical protein [Sphingomonas sp.]